MIVWLASYPKSGNTWLRAFLASYMRDADVSLNAMRGWTDMAPEPWEIVTDRYSGDLTHDQIVRARIWVQACIANKELRQAMRPEFAHEQAEDVFVKTHSAIAKIDGYWTINPDVTKGAIYIVRDPRDVCISYASHLGRTVDEAIDLMESPHPLKNEGSPLYQYVGKWCDHAESWADAVGKVEIVRYEDLKTHPRREFLRILRAFGLAPKATRFKRTQSRINRAIERTTFARLQAKEREQGFAERSDKSKDPFFRQGTSGGWRNVLTSTQVARLEAVHGHVMERFGYERSLAMAA